MSRRKFALKSTRNERKQSVHWKVLRLVLYPLEWGRSSGKDNNVLHHTESSQRSNLECQCDSPLLFIVFNLQEQEGASGAE